MIRARRSARLVVGAVVAAVLAPLLALAAPGVATAESVADVTTDPAGQAEVGVPFTATVEVVQVSGSSTDIFGVPTLSVPPTIDVLGAELTAPPPTGGPPTSYPCEIGDPDSSYRVQCDYSGFGYSVPPYTLTATLVADAPTYDQALWFSAGTEFSQIYGSTVIDVVEPGITADLHPSLSGPATGVVGQQLELTGTLVNAGSTDRTGVVATVDVGVGLQLDSARWGGTPSVPSTACAVAGSVATCTLGTMPAWSDEPLVVLATPVAAQVGSTTTVTMAADTPDQVPDPHPDTASAVIDLALPTADLSVDASALDGVVVGQSDVVRVRTRNNGTGPAPGAQVVVDVDPLLPVVSAAVVSPDAGAGPCTVVGQLVTCPLGSLSVNETDLLDIVVAPTTAGTGTVAVTASSAAPEPVPDPNPNSGAFPVTAVDPSTDARSTGTLFSPPTLVAGQQGRFRAYGHHAGPSDVADLTIVVDVPTGWTVVSAVESTSGTPCTVVGPSVTCTAEDLAEDQTVVADLQVVPDVPGSPTVTATVSTPLPDPVPGNEVATPTVIVRDPAVTLAFEDLPSQVDEDRVDDVPVRVRNAGHATTATDVVLTVTVPPTGTIVSAQVGSTPCAVAGQVVTCPLGSIGPLSSRLVDLDVVHSGAAPVVTYQLSATTTAPMTGPAELSHDVAVVPVPDQVAGTLTDPRGRPVTNAQVALFAPGALLPVVSTRTDVLGAYQLTPPAGSYDLRFAPTPQTGLATRWFDGAATRSGATRLTFATGAPVMAADAVLPYANPQPSQVTGHLSVRNAEASATEGTWVLAYRDGNGSFVPDAAAVVGADGTYLLSLPPGTYALYYLPAEGSGLRESWSGGDGRADADRYTAWGDGAPLEVYDGLDWDTGLAGTVRYPSGDPAHGAFVQLYGPGATWLPTAQAQVHADGTWSLDGTLPPADYRIRIVDYGGTVVPEWYEDSATRAGATVVTVAAGVPVGGIDAVVSLVDPQAADVVGAVEGPSGDPAEVAGTWVLAYRDGNGTFTPDGAAVVAGDGTFAMADLAPGTYRLVYLPPSGSGLATTWGGGSPTRTGATPVVLDGSGAPVTVPTQVLGP